MTMRVAIMQPYFFPYAGYFRLMAAADLFVIYDCVQFPRRGRVHRTEISRHDGASNWLTLPLAHQPQTTRIDELRFHQDARDLLDRRLAGLHWLRGKTAACDAVRQILHGSLKQPMDLLESCLSFVASAAGLSPHFMRSSALAVPRAYVGEARIIEIARRVGATHYLNAPGGRDLYAYDNFARRGIDLQFLLPFEGSILHMLPALCSGETLLLQNEVRDVRVAAASRTSEGVCRAPRE